MRKLSGLIYDELEMLTGNIKNGIRNAYYESGRMRMKVNYNNNNIIDKICYADNEENEIVDDIFCNPNLGIIYEQHSLSKY